MTDPIELNSEAEALLRVGPNNRAELMAWCYGYLDQTVKSYLNDYGTRDDLTRAQRLLELTLDLHQHHA